jgi:hypothetical protein
LPERTGDPLDRQIVLSSIERKQTHEMQSFGMVRIDRKRLPAALSGIATPSRLSQAKGSRAKRFQTGWCRS